MKRLVPILLLATFALPGFAVEKATKEDRPYYCKYPPGRGLTDEQEKICGADPEGDAKKEKAAQELKPPKYPFKVAGFYMVDPATAKPLVVSLSSEDGSQIVVGFPDSSNDATLGASDVLSWNSAPMGSGTDASGAVGAVVGGALFFWPMLLAAPFMVKNYTVTGIKIEYIDKLGYDKSFNLATNESPKATMELLKFSTKLEPGAKRDEDFIKAKRQIGLQNSMAELDRLREPLLVKNGKKPWCTYLSLKDDDSASTAYSLMLTHVKSLRKSLGLEIFVDPSANSSEAQWQEYLNSKPGLKEWSLKYKPQAEAIKKCG